MEEESQLSLVIPDEVLVAQYYDLRHQLDQLIGDMRAVVTHPTYSLPFLKPGRLVQVKYKDIDFGWGVIINYQKRLPPRVNPLLFSIQSSYLYTPIESTYACCRGTTCPRAVHC